MLESSLALRLTLLADTPRSFLSPSMVDCTSMAMRFCALAPAPDSAAPPRPPARATAPAKTVASMFCVERASKLSAPPASMFEFRLKACTRPAVFNRSTCSHFVRSLNTCCVSQVHSARDSSVAL